MCPYLGSIDMYKFFVNIGTIVAAAVFIIMVYFNIKGFIRSSIIIAMFALSMVVSAVGGQFLRKLTLWSWNGFNEFLTSINNYEGTHFLGRILLVIVVFAFLWNIIMRREEGSLCKYGLAKVFDIFSFFMVIQHFFNKVACFMRGCCYGKPYYGIFSVRFLPAGIDYSVYPTQLFEILGMILLFIYMLDRYRKNKAVFPYFCIGYGLIIFVSEFFMDQTGTRLFLGMSFIQLAAIILIILGIVHLSKMRRREKKKYI